jgi:hypothetical protein
MSAIDYIRSRSNELLEPGDITEAILELDERLRALELWEDRVPHRWSGETRDEICLVCCVRRGGA